MEKRGKRQPGLVSLRMRGSREWKRGREEEKESAAAVVVVEGGGSREEGEVKSRLVAGMTRAV